MAIGTYGQLKTAVANWLHRTDLTSIIPDFILLAEANIRRDVRCRAMWNQTSGTLSGTTLAVPTGMIEATRVVIDSYVKRYVTPEQFYPYDDGDCGVYTIQGSNFVFSTGSSAYVIDYVKAFTAFSDDGDTNWLLTNHADIYLFAALAEAAEYIGQNPAGWLTKYRAALQRLRQSEQTAAGPLVVSVSMAGVV